MNPRVLSISLALMMVLPAGAALAAAPAACDASNPAYQPMQATHHYAWTSFLGVSANGSPGGVGLFNAFDTSGCPAGDGDNDLGVGGAQLPLADSVGTSACALANGHHGDGRGGGAYVTNNAGGLDVFFSFGTDGQKPDVSTLTSPCTGDGVISDDYDTDPFDCGSGWPGESAIGLPARLAGNPNPHAGTAADPDPWAAMYGPVPQGAARADPNGGVCLGVDGSGWVFLSMGPNVWIVNPPLVDVSGCPGVGDGAAPVGASGCGLHGAFGGASLSVPIAGDVTDP